MPGPLFVRQLKSNERKQLEQWSKHKDGKGRHLWARVILLSAEGYRVSEIARIVNLLPKYVRQHIHRFNEIGLIGLEPKPRPGRPHVLKEDVIVRLTELVQTPPRTIGKKFSRWTLKNLLEESLEQGLIKQELSLETLRQALRKRGFELKRLSSL